MCKHTQTTRTFDFPNGGHSMRKLSNALRELGDQRVELVIEGDDKEQLLYFRATESTKRPVASKLADRLLLAGTRFTINAGNSYTVEYPDGTTRIRWSFQMEVYTDVSDLMHNPGIYGLD